MTCAEFQRELPEYMEEGGSAELKAHLKGCSNCSGLVTSLQSIITGARELQASEEPSPRVWNSIEIALRRENLIREPRREPRHSILPSLRQRWGIAGWLVPAAAGLLVIAGIVLYQQRPQGTQATNMKPASVVTTRAGSDVSDEQLLREVSLRAPLMRATYESNLKDVNNYIKDAQDSVDANPNDEQAQQALMDAYGQKSMIYEMALDRSLP
jgi:hypothetical protein